jgi:aldehyde dehydrogenase (NAD+)
MENVLHEVPTTSLAEIQRVFELQQRNASKVAATTYRERTVKLKALQNWLSENNEKITTAIYKDFKKPEISVLTTELLSLATELKHTISHLREWMKPTKVGAPLPLIGTKSYIQYEAKGVCLIIAPWNYPFLLAVHPLISAIAAGNTAIVKPSELTPHTSALIREMVEALFDKEEVAVIEGGVEVSQELLSKPFNHIFFTGSPRVGKIVMRAAAEHLASCTLELGGKSPTLVDKTANMYTTGQKIAWGKLMNNGQTCTAPDYILVEEKVKDKLIESIIKFWNKMLNPNNTGIKTSPDYARIVNSHHFNRLKGLLEDAIEKGAKIEFGGDLDEADLYFSPTILTNVTNEMRIAHEEIFGPILPIFSWTDKTQALQHILDRPKPLALYIFTKSTAFKNYFLDKTSSGGTVINDCLLHYAHNELPFGGVNNSGIGRGGGHYGFLDFSNTKSVLEQKWGQTSVLFPPYTDKVKTLANFIAKWL